MPREVRVRTIAQPLIGDNLGRCSWSEKSSANLQCSFKQEETD
jgi:hypothetical protein